MWVAACWRRKKACSEILTNQGVVESHKLWNETDIWYDKNYWYLLKYNISSFHRRWLIIFAQFVHGCLEYCCGCVKNKSHPAFLHLLLQQTLLYGLILQCFIFRAQFWISQHQFKLHRLFVTCDCKRQTGRVTQPR